MKDDRPPGYTPPALEDLRTEYSACESHVGMLNQAVFQSAAIVVGGSIAGLLILINVDATYRSCIQMTILAVGVIVVTLLWQYNWLRHSTSTRNRWKRMRTIESQLGMRANTIAFLLSQPPDERETTEEWAMLADDERRLVGYRRYWTLPFLRTGQRVLHATADLVLLMWIAAVTLKWIEVVDW